MLQRRQQFRTRARRGSAYVAILGMSMLVAVIGTSALIAARVQLRTSSRSSDVDETRNYALAAIDLARLLTQTDPNWRRVRSSGVWVTSQAIGSGTLSIEGVDPNDGDLGNWETDPVVLTGIGAKGTARHLASVTLLPKRTAYTSLNTAVAASGALLTDSGTVVANAPVTSNASVSATGASTIIEADVEAVGTITGGRYLGSRTSGAAAREFPAAASVFDAYVASGTAISYASTGGALDKCLLTPSRNPFGAQTNAYGIYVIDCAGQKLSVKKCRVVGTLIILNPKSDSTFDNAVIMEPAVVNFPALMIRGQMKFVLNDATLKESEAGNLNPPGAPYSGSSDGDASDIYPSEIRGLVYQAGSFVNSETLTIVNGSLIVDGTLNNTKTLNVTYAPSNASNPPPGFSSKIVMQPQLGSWKQVVR